MSTQDLLASKERSSRLERLTELNDAGEVMPSIDRTERVSGNNALHSVRHASCIAG